MTAQTIYLEDEFGPIVSAVSTALLPQLQLVNPRITGVHYEFGHPLEIIETLTEKQSGTTQAFNRYPLVALFLDIDPVDRGGQVGIYAEYTLHMAIIHATEPNYKALQRKEKVFKPILDPIYTELFKQIGNRGDLFQIEDRELIQHRPVRRYYWGRQGLFGNTGNIFNDAVDCIEIKNLKLKVNINYCPKPIV